MSKQQIVSSLVVVVMLVLLMGSITSVYASSNSPYQSGYEHGEDDCGEDEDDKYINQPGKGPSHHTRAFMNGYNDAIANCDEENGNGGNGNGNGNGGNGDKKDLGDLENDIRNACMKYLKWSESRCQNAIDSGKMFLICRALNAFQIYIC